MCLKVGSLVYSDYLILEQSKCIEEIKKGAGTAALGHVTCKYPNTVISVVIYDDKDYNFL